MRELRGGLRVIITVIICFALLGCAYTVIEIPIRLPTGEIVMARYSSTRDSAIEGAVVELNADGTFRAEIHGASGDASTPNAQTWAGINSVIESASRGITEGAVRGARVGP